MNEDPKRCSNLNHTRTRSMVRFCPDCGKLVGPEIPPEQCGNLHDQRRRERTNFCHDCGTKLR